MKQCDVIRIWWLAVSHDLYRHVQGSVRKRSDFIQVQPQSLDAAAAVLRCARMQGLWMR